VTKSQSAVLAQQPSIESDIPQYYLAVTIAAPEQDSRLCYDVCLVVAAEVLFSSKTHKVERLEKYVLSVELDDSEMDVAWQDA
jgi:hypothetical protein